MRQVIRPAAKNDIIRQFRYYALQDAFKAADRFLKAIDDAVEAHCKMPLMGAPRPLKNATVTGLACGRYNISRTLSSSTSFNRVV